MEKYCKTYTIATFLKTEIACNTPIFTAVTQNHGNGQKLRYMVKITVITAIVNSWFSYSPRYQLFYNYALLCSGCPGKKAVKRVCVRVCVYVFYIVS